MRLALLFLVATLAASAAAAQPSGGGILAVSPAPRLALDAGLGERAALLPVPAGPRARGAWRGARRGFLVGLAIGAAGTAAAFVLADKGQARCEYICNSTIAAILTVPLVAITTTAGAVIGATNVGGPVPLRSP